MLANSPLLLTARGSSYKLLWVGMICTVFGLTLLKRAWDHDTLLPGTLTIYIPRWIFIVAGLLFQIPLIAAYSFLSRQGIL